MNNLLDSHTHTIMSGHAYSTMNDMIRAARDRDLSLIALTEHAPAMPGTCNEMYFHNFKVLPRKYGDIWVLFGAELNILDRDGHVDLDDDTISKLDVAVASIHPPCYHETGSDANTEAYLNAMKNTYINIIGHPDDGRFPVDYEALVRGAKESGKLLEVNDSSLSPASYRVNALENYREMLKLCKRYEVPVIVDSDAHVDRLVGECKRAFDLLRDSDFPCELVVNTDINRYFSYINFDLKEA